MRASAQPSEQQDFRDYALVDTIKSIIPVLDSFDRALQTYPAKSEFHSGMELIHKQLVDALSKLGVKPIRAKGEQFDPRYHEAIEMVDTEDADDQEGAGRTAARLQTERPAAASGDGASGEEFRALKSNREG